MLEVDADLPCGLSRKRQHTIGYKRMARKPRKRAPDKPVPAGALLVRERDRLRRILEASPVGVTTVTLDGRIDYANARAAEILGESVKSLLGQTYESVAARSVDPLGEPIPPGQHLLQRLLRERPPMLVVRRVCVHAGRPAGARATGREPDGGRQGPARRRPLPAPRDDGPGQGRGDAPGLQSVLRGHAQACPGSDVRAFHGRARAADQPGRVRPCSA